MLSPSIDKPKRVHVISDVQSKIDALQLLRSVWILKTVPTRQQHFLEYVERKDYRS